MLGAGANSFLQIALLETLDEGRPHGCREIGVFTIRLFQTIETGCATYVDHGRKGQNATHFTHGGTGLAGLQLSQLGVERAGLAYLLGIDGRALGVDAREYLFVEEGWDAIGRVGLQPVLYSHHHVANDVWIAGLLEGKL